MSERKMMKPTILLCLALAGCGEPVTEITMPDNPPGLSFSAQLMAGQYLMTVKDDGVWVCAGAVRDCIRLLSATADRMESSDE